MRKLPPSLVDEEHPDFKILYGLRIKIESLSKGASRFQNALPELFRKALDEVIDTPRTGRRLVSDLEKTEKTYIGTKMEILIRNFLELPKGLLDLDIDGVDVDIKNTLGSNWMIPTEALGKPCILVACDEKTFLCYLGIFVAHRSNLSGSTNKDQKRSLSAIGFENVLWLLKDEPYPPNFWAGISAKDAAYIMEMKKVSGAERLRRLFTHVQKKPIPRNIVESVARQKDYMKRARKNGGARDSLAINGIALLSGTFDKALIKILGLPACARTDLISIKADSLKVAQLLEQYGHPVNWLESKGSGSEISPQFSAQD